MDNRGKIEEVNSRIAKEAAIITEARDNGHLVPIIRFLESAIDRGLNPQRPSGAQWAFARAYDDGAMAFAQSMLSWLNARDEKWLDKTDPQEVTEDGTV